MAGAAERQSQRWSEEDKRKEKLQEQYAELHAKGMEERRKVYAKMQQGYSNMKQMLDSGDVEGAAGVYASMHDGWSAEDRKDVTGKEWQISDPENMRGYLEDQYQHFSNRKEPALEIDKFVVDREDFYKMNEAEHAAYLQKMWNLKQQDTVSTPYKGVYNGKALFKEAPKEKDKGTKYSLRTSTEMKDGVQYTVYQAVALDESSGTLVLGDRRTTEKAPIDPTLDIKPDEEKSLAGALKNRTAMWEEEGRKDLLTVVSVPNDADKSFVNPARQYMKERFDRNKRKNPEGLTTTIIRQTMSDIETLDDLGFFGPISPARQIKGFDIPYTAGAVQMKEEAPLVLNGTLLLDKETGKPRLWTRDEALLLYKKYRDALEKFDVK